jgi:CheY-like chemotaxis protein
MASAVAPVLRGARVLVVDDDADTLYTIQALLQIHGADTMGATSAGEALRLIIAYRPHALVSDLAMPGEDGFALIRKVRTLPRGEGALTPALALTAHAFEDGRRQALGAGFDRYLTKPFSPRRLVETLASMLESLRGADGELHLEHRAGERRVTWKSVAPDRRRAERRGSTTFEA